MPRSVGGGYAFEMRKLGVLSSLCVLLVGCGGGGGSVADSGGGGGGGAIVSAGPLRLEGQMNAPDTAVVTGVTGYSVSGNITSCVYNDQLSSVLESEVIWSRMGVGGYEIVGANFGDGSVRTIAPNLVQPASLLRCDPNGRWVYYVRSGNLQRTDIRDGTSNTILAGVDSFAFDDTGTMLYYRKSANTEIWKAAINGSGQTLVGNYPVQAYSVLGALNAQFLAVRSTTDPRAISFIDVTNGSIFTTITYVNSVNLFFSAYNSRERCLYNSFYFGSAPSGTEYRVERWALASPTGGINQQTVRQSSSALPFSVAWGGAEPRSLVYTDGVRAGTYDLTGSSFSTYSFETSVFGACWNGPRSTIQVVGAGTPFTTGVGAVIVSEQFSRNPAILVADAVTRGTVAVTSLNDTPNGNLIYRIDGDNLSRLSYATANGYAWRHLISASSGLKGAIVTFDGSTGRVANVVTFTKKPVVSRVGGQWKIEGDLVDLIDGKTGAKRPASPSLVLK